MNFKNWLIKQRACSEAIDWVGERTLEQAWPECEHGDWLLWLAQKVGVDLKVLTLAKSRCERLADRLMTGRRSPNALDVSEIFGIGEAPLEQLDSAARAARAALATNAAAYDTARVAARAAFAADAAAYDTARVAARAAADDAAAAYAAYAAASDVARKEALKKCAEIVRETIPLELIKEGIGNEI